MEIPDDLNEGDSNMSQRVPCADDSCIGTIGPDGLCRVCGRPSPEEEAEPTSAENHESEAFDPVIEDGHQPPEPADETSFEKEEEMLEMGEDDWQERVLCSDESCIGVLGADGLCRVCGKPGASR